MQTNINSLENAHYGRVGNEIHPKIVLRHNFNSTTNKISTCADLNTKFSGRILIVDDEQEICNILACYCRNFGFEIDTANNGLEALEKFKNNNYKVLITDYQMPILDGRGLILKIRELQGTQDLKIILCTGQAASIGDSLLNELRALFSLVIFKPFSKQIVYDGISKLLAQ